MDPVISALPGTGAPTASMSALVVSVHSVVGMEHVTTVVLETESANASAIQVTGIGLVVSACNV